MRVSVFLSFNITPASAVCQHQLIAEAMHLDFLSRPNCEQLNSKLLPSIMNIFGEKRFVLLVHSINYLRNNLADVSSATTNYKVLH